MGKKQKLPPLSVQVSEARYCFLSDSSAPSRGLRVLMVGREACDEAYLVDRPGYPSLALELVVAGHGTLVLDGESHDLQPGTVFTYGPGVRHVISSGGGLIKYFADFTGKEGEKLLRASGMSPGSVAMVRNPEPMMALFELLLDRGGSDSPINPELCADYLRPILRGCLEKVPSARGDHRAVNDCYRRAKALLDKEYAVTRSVAALARRLGVTPEHLSRVFRKMGGPSPSFLLNSKKMTHAAGLLLSGGWKVKQVAYELGYATPFHFSSVFKRHFGHPPRILQQRRKGISAGTRPASKNRQKRS